MKPKSTQIIIRHSANQIISLPRSWKSWEFGTTIFIEMNLNFSNINITIYNLHYKNYVFINTNFVVITCMIIKF